MLAPAEDIFNHIMDLLDARGHALLIEDSGEALQTSMLVAFEPLNLPAHMTLMQTLMSAYTAQVRQPMPSPSSLFFFFFPFAPTHPFTHTTSTHPSTTDGVC